MKVFQKEETFSEKRGPESYRSGKLGKQGLNSLHEYNTFIAQEYLTYSFLSAMKLHHLSLMVATESHSYPETQEDKT
jgi:hypothetical protein